MTTTTLDLTRSKAPRICKKIKKSMQDLKKMNLLLKPADKNLGVVAIRYGVYNHLLNKGLSDFERVRQFPQKLIIEKLKSVVNRCKTIGNWRKQKWFDEAKKATTPCPFYIIPKIHKSAIAGRPITAQHSYIIANVSKFLATRLQLEANRFPDIAKDSKAVVRQLEELKLKNKNLALTTFDVVNCYPSIDINDAVL